MPGARGHSNHRNEIAGKLKIKPSVLRRFEKEKPMQQQMNNGGTTARGRGRGRGRGRMERLPGGNLPRQGMMPKGMHGNAGGGKAGVANAGMPGPGGAQLARRVQSGAISQEQADRTMKQRQTLQKAFGKDWRTKVYGDRGYTQRTRTALAKNPDSARLAALNKKLMERRKTMLAAAKKKTGATA